MNERNRHKIGSGLNTARCCASERSHYLPGTCRWSLAGKHFFIFMNQRTTSTWSLFVVTKRELGHLGRLRSFCSWQKLLHFFSMSSLQAYFLSHCVKGLRDPCEFSLCFNMNVKISGFYPFFPSFSESFRFFLIKVFQGRFLSLINLIS
jgi:hypothetical protein